MEPLKKLFDTESFMPHGHCYFWDSSVVWTHVISDLAIALAYYSIPLVLVYFARKRHDLPYRWLFTLFGAFIIACGTTHVMAIITVWKPFYWVDGIIKVITAILSIGTAILTVKIIPQALQLRSPAELEKANSKLEDEIVKRTQAEQAADKRAQELRDANQKLIETEKLKTEFFSNVSHELRTPLTLIISPLESIMQGKLSSNPSEQKQAMQIMHHNSIRLLQMITGLLDFSKMEAGKLPVNREPTNLTALTELIVADFKPLANQKDIKLELQFENIDHHVDLDRYLYERILFNLLSNAIKFTPKGGSVHVKVGIKLNLEDDMLILSVKDTGCGISESDQKNLFQKFRQLEGSSTRRFEGSGLGLALVKEIATLLNGHVSITSQPHHGSTFEIKFAAPRSAVTRPSAPERPHQLSTMAELRSDSESILLPKNGNSLPKVLIAEDNAELVFYISTLLKDFCQLKSARNGHAALEIARTWKPDIILSDIMMPDKDGLTLCREIKADHSLSQTNFIILTALTNRESLLKGWEAGTDEYLYKPFHPEELVTRVRTMLRAIKDRKSKEELLAKKNRDLIRSNSELQQFAYVASHDLQEPLRMVTNYTQLLVNHSLVKSAQEAEEFVSYILEGTSRMQHLIEDLLSYAKIDRVEQRPEEVCLNQVMKEVLENLKASAENAHARITFDSLPTVHTNKIQMVQLFQNLISNALKFHGKEDPHIHISAAQKNSRWEFAVQDNGIGIEPQYREKIFAIFQRLHSRSEYPGTGIGLAICKKIVETNEGHIWVDSEAGKGSTFYFSLPEQQPRDVETQEAI
jgi:signal transduction histidine kinase